MQSYSLIIPALAFMMALASLVLIVLLILFVFLGLLLLMPWRIVTRRLMAIDFLSMPWRHVSAVPLTGVT